MVIPKIDELNAATCRAVSFQKKWPEFYDHLLATYQVGTFTEKLAMYYHGLTEIPTCVVCGKPVKFRGFRLGWRRTCCSKCQGRDPEVISKKQRTMLERYGEENPGKVKSIQLKMKQTCMERYGTTNGGWSKQAQQKIKATNMERRGVEYAMQSVDVRQKSRQTCLKRYGVEHNSQIESLKPSKNAKLKAQATYFKERNMLAAASRHEEIIGVQDGKYICSCPHPNCNNCTEKQYIISPACYWSRQVTERCTHLLPENSSYARNTTLEQFVKAILDRHGITYITNDRKLIGQELDIYCPDLNIAIECNGCYWHSSKFKNHNYHIEKQRLARNAGIQLYYVWEDWVLNTPDIIASMIEHWIGVTSVKIRAHKCSIHEVLRKEGMQFLAANHIQGATPYKIGYGLYYNNELISLMTFGPGRNQKTGWELLRFCTKCGHMVYGGANKLLQHFISVHNPQLIYSYASCDISTGNLYSRLGFTSTGTITASYWYIEPKTNKRYHRLNFSKSKIIGRGWKDNKVGWTEAEVMAEYGYLQIYDAGQTKWTLQLE